MSLKYCLILTLSSLCLLTESSQITEDQSVLILDDDNFDDALRLHKDILVNFCKPFLKLDHLKYYLNA